MQLCRLILPDWAASSKLKRVLEGEFDEHEIKTYNAQGYNIYYCPNGPDTYTPGLTVEGSQINTFNYVFVDMDLKDGIYSSKEEFLEILYISTITPTQIVDSGNGIHAYWLVNNLDAMSYLRFQRRLMRLFQTDEAIGQIFQLMRVPNTINTKRKDRQVPCRLLSNSSKSYTAEQLDKMLPPILIEDEQYCQHHYDSTYNKGSKSIRVSDKLPSKFGKLLNENKEAKVLWGKDTDDRSRDDYRLGHLMFANDFTKEEAMSVLVNSAKALQRSPVHQLSYADNIVSKIWTFEMSEDKDKLDLSLSVREILQRGGTNIRGTRFPCHKRIDNTEYGFRLGQVIGLVAGSGVGKTTFALNMFRWFCQANPDYHHFFIPLEQPANEIADRWATMCGDDVRLHDKVHVISNYDEKGSFRHLSFEQIKDYINKFKEIKGVQVGCIVIDHIGALNKKGKESENQDLMDICHSMKAFAVETNTLLIMQSQSNRQKAGIGDLELDKDAAYGTVYFESYCDYLIALWQPLKRCHIEENCPTVTAFKYCKIRHKKAKLDIIQEDVAYYLAYDYRNEQMRDMTQAEETSFKYFYSKATNLRKSDKKVDLIPYKSVPYKDENGKEITTNINT